MADDRPPRRRRRIPFVAAILGAMALGVIVGLALGPRAAPLSRIGTTILDLIRALAGQLLLFAVLDAFQRTHIRARSGLIMVAIALTNAAIAVAIGLTISNVLKPGHYLTITASPLAERAGKGFQTMTRSVAPDRKIDFLGDLLAIVPTSIVKPFQENAVLSIVLLAVLLGAALRRVKDRQIAAGEDGWQVVDALIGNGLRAVETVLGWVITLVPIAVFAVVAKTVGEFGFEPFRGLAVYLAVGLLGLAIQVLVVYQGWLLMVARVPLGWFWRGAREAVLYAMGTASSLATLPVTLRCLDRMGVSQRSARMAACVGTNLNNDGILLYEAMAALFVAQACGVELTFGHQLLVAASAALAGIGISGIPEAGLISLLIVLRTVDVVSDEQVATIVPLLLTVDWVLGRARAMTNVTSDLVVAVLLDRVAAGPDDEAAEPESVVDVPLQTAGGGVRPLD